MNKLIFIIIGLLILTSCATSAWKTVILPSGQELKVKLAITQAERTRGLSGLDEMAGFDGMFFVNDKPRQVSFWMKDMRFPLDIIYLDETGQVVEIHENEPPCQVGESCPSIISSSDQIKYILEVKAGVAQEYKITNETKIKW